MQVIKVDDNVDVLESFRAYTLRCTFRYQQDTQIFIFPLNDPGEWFDLELLCYSEQNAVGDFAIVLEQKALEKVVIVDLEKCSKLGIHRIDFLVFSDIGSISSLGKGVVTIGNPYGEELQYEQIFYDKNSEHSGSLSLCFHVDKGRWSMQPSNESIEYEPMEAAVEFYGAKSLDDAIEANPESCWLHYFFAFSPRLKCYQKTTVAKRKDCIAEEVADGLELLRLYNA